MLIFKVSKQVKIFRLECSYAHFSLAMSYAMRILEIMSWALWKMAGKCQ